MSFPTIIRSKNTKRIYTILEDDYTINKYDVARYCYTDQFGYYYCLMFTKTDMSLFEVIEQ